MKTPSIKQATLNFVAVVLLIGLIITPLYFATNFAKVAGVKSESKYLIVSQVEKFPGMVFTQDANQYSLTFNKIGSKQAFLDVLILNNPTGQTQTYFVHTKSENTQVFFGHDLDDQNTQIKIPAQSSVQISLYSESPELQNQTIEFKVIAN